MDADHVSRRCFAPCPATPPAPPAGRADALGVLVVDDDRDTADALAGLVSLWGHAVRVCGGGDQALQALAAGAADVALLDIAMPGMDGNELARRIGRAPGPRPLLVAVTGYADDAHRQLCVDAGFDHVLIKPADPEAVRVLLDGADRGGGRRQ